MAPGGGIGRFSRDKPRRSKSNGNANAAVPSGTGASTNTEGPAVLSETNPLLGTTLGATTMEDSPFAIGESIDNPDVSMIDSSSMWLAFDRCGDNEPPANATLGGHAAEDGTATPSTGVRQATNQETTTLDNLDSDSQSDLARNIEERHTAPPTIQERGRGQRDEQMQPGSASRANPTGIDGSNDSLNSSSLGLGMFKRTQPSRPEPTGTCGADIARGPEEKKGSSLQQPQKDVPFPPTPSSPNGNDNLHLDEPTKKGACRDSCDNLQIVRPGPSIQVSQNRDIAPRPPANRDHGHHESAGQPQGIAVSFEIRKNLQHQIIPSPMGGKGTSFSRPPSNAQPPEASAMLPPLPFTRVIPQPPTGRQQPRLGMHHPSAENTPEESIPLAPLPGIVPFVGPQSSPRPLQMTKNQDEKQPLANEPFRQATEERDGYQQPLELENSKKEGIIQGLPLASSAIFSPHASKPIVSRRLPTVTPGGSDRVRKGPMEQDDSARQIEHEVGRSHSSIVITLNSAKTHESDSFDIASMQHTRASRIFHEEVQNENFNVVGQAAIPLFASGSGIQGDGKSSSHSGDILQTNDHDIDFDEIHAKFLGDIRDLEDLQDSNSARLLEIQGLFATAYAESLHDQAGFLDLLHQLEKASLAMDDIIARLHAI